MDSCFAEDSDAGSDLAIELVYGMFRIDEQDDGAHDRVRCMKNYMVLHLHDYPQFTSIVW